MEKDKIGVALKYYESAPQIVAKAKGKLLAKLLEIAEYNKITIFNDSDLAQVLSGFDTGSEIPEDLFRAVSEVMAYCYKVNSNFRDKIDSSGK